MIKGMLRIAMAAASVWLTLYLSAPARAAGTIDETTEDKSATEARISMTGELSRPSGHTPAWIAYTFLFDHKRQWGIRHPRQDWTVTVIERRSPTLVQVHLQRQLYQTPVWGDRLVFDIDGGGVIRSVSGTLHPKLERQLFGRPQHPAISPSTARGIAQAWLQSGYSPPASAGEVRLHYYPYSNGVALVYAVPIERSEATGQQGEPLLVHALSGRIVIPNT